ncbi:methionine--tRNA ligase [soil metagenome]
MTQKRYFISTSIPYVNAQPHVGHALEFIQTDAYARFHRQQGQDVFFLTGSDENALKNVQAAEAEGITTQELVDRNVIGFQNLLTLLDCSNDDFIRTSVDPRHQPGASRIWQQLVDAGDVYRKHYTGLYCVGCEAFYSPEELENGLCPIHGTKPVEVEEENYFFRLSKHGDELHRRISSDELKIIPTSRKNEVLRFIESGLADISISRSQERARGWGVPVPGDPGQVMYVWIDALSNYITALDYGTDGETYGHYWQNGDNRVHAIGKDILRFHAIYWPAMLLSAGIPLPTRVVVHGFLTIDGRKMSKSLGNVVDPAEVTEKYGADAVRYYMLREVTPSGDGDFSIPKLESRYNADLANDLGNLLNRTVSMINRYRAGIVPEPGSDGELETALKTLTEDATARSRTLMFNYEPQQALTAIWEIVTAANTYVEQSAPWTLSKAEKGGDETAGKRLDTVLFTLASTLSRLAWLLQPYIPASVEKIAEQLGSSEAGAEVVAGQQVEKPQPLFPRIEEEAAV